MVFECVKLHVKNALHSTFCKYSCKRRLGESMGIPLPELFVYHLKDPRFQTFEVCHGEAFSFDRIMKYDQIFVSFQQQTSIIGQQYPVVRNGDRHYGHLFFYGKSKRSVFEPGHSGNVLTHDAPFGEYHQIVSIVKFSCTLAQGVVAAFQIFPIEGDVDIAIHIAKKGDFAQAVLTDKYGSHLVDSNSRNIEIRKMVGTKYILFF